MPSPTTTVAGVPRGVDRIGGEWARLGRPTVDPRAFSTADLGGLPEPAVRWLTHVITPGTPLWRTAEISMVGKIRLGRWFPFTATQIIRPAEGYVWAADVRVCGIPLVGFDRLSSGTGEMRWSLLDRLPLVRAHGQDVTRSAAGRLASEIALAPTAYDTAVWGVGRYPFRVSFENEHTQAGVTLPERIRAGWWWGTARQQEGEFFRATITQATFR